MDSLSNTSTTQNIMTNDTVIINPVDEYGINDSCNDTTGVVEPVPSEQTKSKKSKKSKKNNLVEPIDLPVTTPSGEVDMEECKEDDLPPTLDVPVVTTKIVKNPNPELLAIMSECKKVIPGQVLKKSTPNKPPVTKVVPLTPCGFCGDCTHLFRNAEGVNICPVLRDTICPFCGESGHTAKNCSMTREDFLMQKFGNKYVPPTIIGGKEVRIKQPMTYHEVYEQTYESDGEYSQEPVIESDPNSWAGHIKKNLTPPPGLSQFKAKKPPVKPPVKRVVNPDVLLWEQSYMVIMPKKFGPFWALRVEDTKYDYSLITEELRENSTVRTDFEVFLEQQYGEDWLRVTAETELDCAYLRKIRHDRRFDNFEALFAAGTQLGLLKDPKELVIAKKPVDNWHKVGKND